jgi:serine phosphatase RsbU (regulator of sigma subunit)
MEKKQETLEFDTHNINLVKGDMLYIFSDGYADQFGGYEGKKFKYRRFRHLLLNIHNLPLEKQKSYLEESMEAWKGNQEQVDDILVIGIKADF